MLSEIHAFIAEQGLRLILGATFILAIASALTFLCKAPIHRQRLAELSIAALLLWLAAVLLPMPRMLVWQGSLPTSQEPLLVSGHAPQPETLSLSPAQLAMFADMSSRPAARALLPAEPASNAVQTLPAIAEPWEFDASAWLVGAYSAGSGLMLLYLALGAGLLILQLRRSQPAPTWLRSLGRRLMRESGADMPLRILITERSCRPYCLGLRRASIVLPASLCDPRQEAQLCEVLRHEVAHLRQGDYRGQLLFAAALPLLFFHPLFWYLRREARLAAELIADDWAARQSDRAHYARELIALSQGDCPGPAGLLPAMPVIASKNQFYRRMTMLLQRDDDLATSCSPLRRRMQLSLAGLFVAGAASLWGVEPLGAQEPESKSQRELRRENDVLASRIADLQDKLAQLEARLADVLATRPPGEFHSDLIGLGGGAGGRMGEVQPPPWPEQEKQIELRHLAELMLKYDPRVDPAVDPGAEPKFKHLDDLQLAEILRAVGQQRAVEADRSAAMIDAWRAVVAEQMAEEVVAVEEIEVVEPPELPDLVDVPLALPPDRRPEGLPLPVPSTQRPAQNYDVQVVANSAVLDLVTRHIDLTAELRQSEVHMAQTKALAEESLVSKSDLRAAEIGFEALHQKLDVLRRVMDVEVRAAKMGLESLSRQLEVAEKLGGSTAEIEGNMMRLEARIELLRSVH